MIAGCSPRASPGLHSTAKCPAKSNLQHPGAWSQNYNKQTEGEFSRDVRWGAATAAVTNGTAPRMLCCAHSAGRSWVRRPEHWGLGATAGGAGQVRMCKIRKNIKENYYVK